MLKAPPSVSSRFTRFEDWQWSAGSRHLHPRSLRTPLLHNRAQSTAPSFCAPLGVLLFAFSRRYGSQVTAALWIQLGSVMLALCSVAAAWYTIRDSARRETAREARVSEERRQVLVGQVIGRLERITRTQVRPVFARLWVNYQLEFSLAVPQMALLVNADEEILLRWFAARVKRMKGAPSDASAATIAIETTGALADWSRGKKTLQWFAEDLLQPVQRQRWSHLRPVRPTLEAGATILLTALVAGGTLGILARAERVVGGLRSARSSRLAHGSASTRTTSARDSCG